MIERSILRTEFPDYPAEDIMAMPESFDDSSWHNDICPSFTSSELKLMIYTDYADPARRELPNAKRFVVFPLDDDDNCIDHAPPLLQTDDWGEVLALVARQKARI